MKHIHVIGGVAGIVLCSFTGVWMLQTGWSYFLALISLLIVILIASWLVWKAERTNRQTAAFFNSLRNDDFCRYPEANNDPFLNHLCAEMNRITTLFSSNRRMQEEKQLYYESLIRVLTHEIRNSITPISSLSADMLAHADQSSPTEIKEGLEVIHRQTEGLSTFLDAYHRLTHLPDPELQRVDPGLLFTKLNRLLFAEPNHDCIHYAMPDGIMLKADPNLLVLALINLIRNALQAIDGQADGLVKVEATLASGYPMITVTDNGPGIPAQWLETVFTPFFSTKASGSGIGLSLSRRIMQLHNGMLTVDSTPSVQTIFSMRFGDA